MLIAFVLCSCLWNAQWSESEIKYYLSIYLSIIDSNVFEAIGVREIGLTSFSIVFGGFTFGTGITFADFHVSGIIPSRNELLKIAVKGPARILA